MSGLQFDSGYFRNAWKSDEWQIQMAQNNLGQIDYDTMVGIGLSGALVVPVLAKALHKDWAIIRKPGESKHTAQPWEGTIGERWLFVDDFIATGATLRQVKVTIDTQFGARPDYRTALVGAYLYEGAPVFLDPYRVAPWLFR